MAPLYSGFVLAVWMTVCLGCLKPAVQRKVGAGQSGKQSLALPSILNLTMYAS